MKSMTGYVSHQCEIAGISMTIELRSVNHRFLDCSMKVPGFFSCYENDIRKLLQQHISRGKVSFSVSAQRALTEHVMVNEGLMESVVSALKKAKKKYGLQGEVSISDVVRLPNIFSWDTQQVLPKKAWDSLQSAITDAAQKFNAMRSKEGKALIKDIMFRIKLMSKTLRVIAGQKKQFVAEYRAKFAQRVNDFLANDTIDEIRLAKEVAILLEKADVTEEIVRLESHIHLFAEKIEKQEICGKDLDFIAQEMNREANTIASKARDSSIVHDVIILKAEVEKIREQVQNIE